MAPTAATPGDQVEVLKSTVREIRKLQRIVRAWDDRLFRVESGRREAINLLARRWAIASGKVREEVDR